MFKFKFFFDSYVIFRFYVKIYSEFLSEIDGLFVMCYVWCLKVLSCNLSCMKVMSCYLCVYYSILVKENCVHICVQFFWGGGVYV